jgi:membrane protease YdiL (CAAX protease family)
MSVSTTASKRMSFPLAMAVWPIMLLISMLPDILFQELTGSRPAWLYWAKVGFLAVVLLASLLMNWLKPLRFFFSVVLIIFLLDWGVARAYERLGYQDWFVSSNAFVQQVGPTVLPRATTALLLVLILWVGTRSFSRFFLVKGKLDALAQPIPLIVDRPTSWKVLGPAIRLAMCLGLIAFSLIFGTRPSAKTLLGVLPLLPFVLLFAVANAFGEEMLYRAPWLAGLEIPLGTVQALLVTAAYFGISHYYGVPYGILGCIMAFIPGWLMGKSMLETRGFFWAWMIHFCMDVAIFIFIAMGSVVPGG